MIIFPVIAVIAATALYTLSCTPGKSSKDQEQELHKIRVILDWVPNTNHTGIYAAQSLGYFMEEGLEVEIIQPSEGGSADLVAAGQGDFGISYQEEVTYARTADSTLPIVAVAAIIQHNTSGFASPVQKNIKSPADFENKKYGGWGSPMEEAILKGLMEKYGADFKKLKIVNTGAADFFTSVTKDVDFSWIYYGWDGVASEVKNFEINFMLLQELDSRLDFYTPVIISSEETVKKNPELVKKFLRSVQKGYIYAVDNPDSAAEILIYAVPEIDGSIVKASQKYLAGQYIAESEKWGEMQLSIWRTFSDWMYENNLIENRLQAEKAFTNEFLP
jgi:ABC-type nitrate/sulfonate/bicarbonate transport system substrate-binding protein